MVRTAFKENRKALSQSLEEPVAIALLSQLKVEHACFGAFRNWNELITQAARSSGDNSESDALLRPILTAHAAKNDPVLSTVILLIFWRCLMSRCARKHTWDFDSEERWQNCQYQLLQIVAHFDLARRPSNLIPKIVNEVMHRVHGVYAGRWKCARMEVNVHQSLAELAVAVPPDPDWAYVHDLRDASLLRLKMHFDEGRIDAHEFHVIAQTRIVGRSLHECAVELGVNYDSLQKQRKHAERGIREYDRNS